MSNLITEKQKKLVGKNEEKSKRAQIKKPIAHNIVNEIKNVKK